MKTKNPAIYGGLAVLGYVLYKKYGASKTAPLVLTQPTAGQGLVAGGPAGTMSGFGAYATGNPMLAELGTLGCSKGY